MLKSISLGYLKIMLYLFFGALYVYHGVSIVLYLTSLVFAELLCLLLMGKNKYIELNKDTFKFK